MRFGSWFFLVVGVGCLVGAAVLGVRTVQQVTEISAYHHASRCPAGAPADASCLQAVVGSVTAVTESPGGGRVSAVYQLDVRTASTTLDLTFSSDSAMLGYALDGDRAVVTMWRGIPVSVETDGRTEGTTSVPETAMASDLTDTEECAGVGVFLVLAAFGMRRSRKAGGTQPLTSPVAGAAVLALVFGSFVVVFGGIGLGGKPSRLAPDLIGTGAGLVVVLGLAAWVGIRVSRRAARSPALLYPRHGRTGDGHGLPAPVPAAPDLPAPDLPAPDLPAPPRLPAARTPLRARTRPANAAVLGARAVAFVPVLLTVGVLFGAFLSAQDGPPARAYEHAPACVGETNLATCVGDFTAVINGVRAPANGANGALVSYVTYDDAINAWANLGGDSAAIVRAASAEQKARTLLAIRVWRRSIVGAELGGSWHWVFGDPPGDTIPTVFLAVCFGLLLLLVRLRVHRRARTGGSSGRLLLEDIGQVAAAAGSVVVLAYGFWEGAILAVVALAWLGVSARQSARRSRIRASFG